MRLFKNEAEARFPIDLVRGMKNALGPEGDFLVTGGTRELKTFSDECLAKAQTASGAFNVEKAKLGHILAFRMPNKKDAAQRFAESFCDPTAFTGGIEVEEEIARVRGDIERMEGEQKELEHRVSFATVELQLTEEYRAQLNPPAASVSTRIYNAFVKGYHDASETVLGIVLFFAENGPTLLTWVAILALPAILVWRRYRRALATL